MLSSTSSCTRVHPTLAFGPRLTKTSSLVVFVLTSNLRLSHPHHPTFPLLVRLARPPPPAPVDLANNYPFVATSTTKPKAAPWVTSVPVDTSASFAKLNLSLYSNANAMTLVSNDSRPPARPLPGPFPHPFSLHLSLLLSLSSRLGTQVCSYHRSGF